MFVTPRARVQTTSPPSTTAMVSPGTDAISMSRGNSARNSSDGIHAPLRDERTVAVAEDGLSAAAAAMEAPSERSCLRPIRTVDPAGRL